MKAICRSIVEFKEDGNWRILIDADVVMQHYEPGYTVNRLPCSTKKLSDEEIEESTISNDRVEKFDGKRHASAVTLAELNSIDWEEAKRKESHKGSGEFKNLVDSHLEDKEIVKKVCTTCRLIRDEYGSHDELGRLYPKIEEKEVISEVCKVTFDLEDIKEMINGVVIEKSSGKYSLKPARVKDKTSEDFLQIYHLMKKAKKTSRDLDSEEIRIVYSIFP